MVLSIVMTSIGREAISSHSKAQSNTDVFVAFVDNTVDPNLPQQSQMRNLLTLSNVGDLISPEV